MGARKKSQFSIVEMIMVFSLFAFTLGFLYEAKEPVNTDYEFTIESFLDAIYYNETIVQNALAEDLSNSLITQNWTDTQNKLDLAFSSYSLIISNDTVSKRIFNCNSTYNRYITQRPVSISNQTSFEFRTITLEVCY